MFALKAHAKINWFLHVLGKRADGYHEIRSLMQRISLHDVLEFEASDEMEVVTGAPIPMAENLVYKAALALREAAGVKKGVRITLKKLIPIAAGLGGGSSDAACALIGLNRLWGARLSRSALSATGALLGSDVPFFLNGPAALAEGRGERITPVGITASHTLLIAMPLEGVSAGWAYSRLKEMRQGGVEPSVFIEALDSRDFGALSSLALNDLEAHVVSGRPDVKDLKSRMLDAGALACSMCGSGSAVFGLFRDRAGAEAARQSTGAHWSSVVETVI